MFDLNKHWAKHFKNYDLFMNAYSGYRKTLEFHTTELRNNHYVLDDGCGTGNLTIKLLQERHKVSAIDPSPAAITKTRIKCAPIATPSRLDLKIMSGETLEYSSNNFDGISSVFVIPFTEDTERYISEMFRVSKQGGKIVISAWPPKSDRASNIMLDMVGEFRETGMLPKYQREWTAFLKTSRYNSTTVANSKNTIILQELLAKTGFTNIKTHENNPYGENAVFITCNKYI